MLRQSIVQTIRRYRTLQTHRIFALPIVILMPHSACNCRCVMCDIWKDNKSLKQLTEKDIYGLLQSFKKFSTRKVLMSGGEALLHPNFFRLCRILSDHQIQVSLLSTGLSVAKNAEEILENVNDLIVSLDGDETTHDRIRNVPGAFQKLQNAVISLKSIRPGFRITARTVIHRLNFHNWPSILEAGKKMGLDQMSFLPADVSSHAFNREVLWSDERKHEILPDEDQLPELKKVLEKLFTDHKDDIQSGFISESPAKLQKIYAYYAAFYGHNPFPYKKCNAPWVSAVIEADGTLRPCFFHPPLGNIREDSMENILNSAKGIRFRKELDIDKDPTCSKCVCYLNLPPGSEPN